MKVVPAQKITWAARNTILLRVPAKTDLQDVSQICEGCKYIGGAVWPVELAELGVKEGRFFMDGSTSLSADHAQTGLTGTSFVSEEPSSAFQTPMSSCRSEPMLTGRHLTGCVRVRG